VFEFFFKWNTRFIISVSFPYFHPLTCHPLLLPLCLGFPQHSCQIGRLSRLFLNIVSDLERSIGGDRGSKGSFVESRPVPHIRFLGSSLTLGQVLSPIFVCQNCMSMEYSTAGSRPLNMSLASDSAAIRE
jgi:hypothetical protein